jgi:hypothetical protein
MAFHPVPSSSFVRLGGRSFAPTCALPAAARGAGVKAGYQPLVLALTPASTMRPSSRSGCDRDDLEIATACKNAPGDPRELIGERNDELDSVQALGGGLDPVLEAVPLPARGSQKHGMSPLHKQDPQVTIAAF